MGLSVFCNSSMTKLDKLQLAMEIVQSALLVAEELDQTHTDYYGTLLQKESVLNQKISSALKNAVAGSSSSVLMES